MGLNQLPVTIFHMEFNTPVFNTPVFRAHPVLKIGKNYVQSY